MATLTIPSSTLRFAGLTLVLATLGSGFTSCSGSSSNSTGTLTQPSGARLLSIQHGKLVDVYGLKTIDGTQIVSLHQSDMLVGVDIQDERDAGSSKRDGEILYDFISANPDTLQPRLLITREIGTEEFNDAVAKLDNNLRPISPNSFGKNSLVAPYSVVPRNAAIRLVFSQNLGIDSSFFYETDDQGHITGIKNTQAIQLLKIVGDPNNSDPTGDFQVIDARLAVRDNLIIVDPVLLGTEGLQYGSRNTASGLPASPNQIGANIRLAVAFDGPLSIPGLAEDKIASLNGKNNDNADSVIRDFRSGNDQDNSSDLSRGFIRDPLPPRLIGEMLMYIERVESAGAGAKQLTLFKNGIDHELDRGDLLRVFLDSFGSPIASLEILQDPTDDLGKPSVQRVRVLVRPILNAKGEDVLELNDPSERPDFPRFAGPERETFLRAHAPKTVLVAEFTRRRARPASAGGTDPYYGDDPRNFLSFSPRPLPNDNGLVVGNQDVSPFAGAILRFSKPIDMSTLIALDTLFFGTRNLLDQGQIQAFIAARNIEPTSFSEAKFRTPHLIHSRIFDEDGSQTSIRIQPTLGFYLDQVMRDAYEKDKALPFEQQRFHYFLHLVSGLDGIADLSGNSLDFQTLSVPGQSVTDNLVMEFNIDSRMQSNGTRPRFEDNIAIYNVRRFADADEDERPSLYLDTEITTVGSPTPADGWRSADFFGPVSYLPTGELIPRSASRVTKVVDNLNQQSAPPQTSDLRWCPLTGPSGWGKATLISSNSANTAFGGPIRNPINPFGCRLQMLWREVDMSLSRTDPLDFNLDVEQLYWAPYTQNAIVFDEFDRMTLYLGHSEYRPEACIASGDAFPSMPNSGLRDFFETNYAHNFAANGKVGHTPPKHPAYIDAVMTISAKDAILEINGVNRYLPLPKFIDASKASNLDNPYFVWRDEQEIVQGGNINQIDIEMDPYPFLLSPFLGGKGRKITGDPGALSFTSGGWHNARDRQLRNGNLTDAKTGGCVGTIALPLLADFWTYPDSPDKPFSDPFRASGVNGWQISLPVTSSASPNFRLYSAGKGGASPFLLDPTHAKWQKGSGGFAPGGAKTIPADNSVYWVMADFLKRTAVVTSGFVDIANPHRMPTNSPDPRLGPYDRTGKLPTFTYDFEPPLRQLPPGTTVIAQFRGTGKVSSENPWWPKIGAGVNKNLNDATTFPLDPLKAGDAHIHHWDTRNVAGTAIRKRWWSFLYNNTVTSYTENPNDLADTTWTDSHSGPYDSFEAKDVEYFNWRFIMKNNVEVAPPVSPKIESFSVAYRLTSQ